MNSPISSPGSSGLEKPTTSPCALMSIGVCQLMPPRLGISVGLPFLSQSTAWRALKRPTAWSQSPEMPTTWPLSLMAVAAEVESTRGRARAPRLDLAVAPALRVP